MRLPPVNSCRMPDDHSPFDSMKNEAQESGMMGLVSRMVDLCLQRKVGVLVLFASLVVIGFIASSGIPRELMPQGFVGQGLSVSVPWSNTPTKEVLEKITLPLEDELSTVKGLDRINSNTRVGSANVYLTFKRDVDMDVAYREVRDRVQRAQLLFPDEVDRHYIGKEDPSSIPIAMVGVTIPEGVSDYYNLIQDKIITPLSRVDGVARVDAQGLEQKEILIDIDRSRAEGSGVNLYEVSEELRGDNFTLASGFVRDGNAKLALRSVAEYNSLEDLENRPINRVTQVKDIGEIKYELPERQFSIRVNSQDAFALAVSKEGVANTVATCRKIDAEIQKLMQDPSLRGIHLEAFFNQGKLIEMSLDNLTDSGVLGGTLAAIVLLFFLQRFRMTLIIALSIPTSLLIALTVMYFTGETLNILTMLALVICVGLLVDNSVVVAENIYRLIDNGLDRRTACIQGVSEIALAISMATATTIIVFLPMSLIGGPAQFWLQKLSVPIIVSLIGSLVVALLFIPLAVFVTQRPSSDHPHHSAHGTKANKQGLIQKFTFLRDRFLSHIYEWTFGRIAVLYSSMLQFFMANRMGLFFTMFLVFGLTQQFVLKEVKFVPSQEEDQMSFNIGVQMSREYSFEDTADYYARAEPIVEKMAEELGLKGYMMMHFSSGGQIQGWLDEENDDRAKAKDAMAQIGEALPKQPGVRLFYGQENNNKGENTEKAVYTFYFFGEDADQLKELTDTLEPTLEKVPGVIGVRYRERRAPNELALVMDRDRLSSSGISPQLVAGVVNYALQGQMLSRYNMDGKEVPIRARFEKKDREKLDDLLSFQIPAPEESGTLPLSALTKPVYQQTPSGIFRMNRRISRSITLDLDPDMTKEATAILSTFRQSMDLPEGVTFESPNQSIPIDDIKNLSMAALLSIVFIYLLMSFLFESFILPLSIILTIPLASLGVLWSHYVGGMDIDVLGCIGGILLIGVVVNNGIVLIDYVNRLRLEGKPRAEALILATQRRFRPITMTALTTIIGMIPLAFSPPNSMGISYKSFGMTLIGGMTSATLLTLLVVPVFYTFFDDARSFLSTVIGKSLTTKPSSVSGSSSTSGASTQ